MLDRQFTVEAPDTVWLAGPSGNAQRYISYILTREGWLYLAVVLDLFSRHVVGWAMDERMPQELTLAALDMAVKRRRPLPGLDAPLRPRQPVCRRRLPETARRTRHRLLDEPQGKLLGARQGQRSYNAPMESFFHTLKTELVHHRDYQTRDEARRDIFEYIEVFYNRRRLHSTLGYLSPAQFEVTVLAA